MTDLERTSNLELTRLAHQLERRDLQLWSIYILAFLVVTSGVAALVIPNVFWASNDSSHVLLADSRYVPQLLFGLIVLIVLFNIYILQQRNRLNTTREELLRELVQRQAAEKLSLIDPLTQTFNRRYMDEVFVRDLHRLERQNKKATFVMVDVDDFKSVNTRFGHLVGDQVLAEVALLMKRAFRASDTIIRFGGDEFLAILEGADLEQASGAIERFQTLVDDWNVVPPIAGYQLHVTCGYAELNKGEKVDDVLTRADQNMYQRKARAIGA